MLVRVDPSFKLEVHIDTDEGNACNLQPDTSVRTDQMNFSTHQPPTNNQTMSEAIGMIETKGYIGSVEASDAMVKAANVTSSKPSPSAAA